MPEEDFELCLSLLGRFLRLNPQRRAEIADELRDHLEERLEELSREGLSREDAVRQAVEEFGDAADLAAHFTQLAKRRRRRFIMRLSLSSAAVVALAVLVGSVLWPELPGTNAPARAIAQQKTLPSAGAKTTTSDTDTDERTMAVEAKLAQRIPKLDLIDTPAIEALDFIRDQIHVDIVVNETSLKEESLTLDKPVNISLMYSEVTAATALDLILERATGGALVYTIRDGFIYIQTTLVAEENLEVRVYNCRDLLQDGTCSSRTISQMSFGADGGSDEGHGQMHMQGGMGSGRTANAVKLLDLIQKTTTGPWSDIDGTGGTMEEFNGLLVVRQTQSIHREIQELLDMLREAAGAKPSRQ